MSAYPKEQLELKIKGCVLVVKKVYVYGIHFSYQ